MRVPRTRSRGMDARVLSARKTQLNPPRQVLPSFVMHHLHLPAPQWLTAPTAHIYRITNNLKQSIALLSCRPISPQAKPVLSKQSFFLALLPPYLFGKYVQHLYKESATCFPVWLKRRYRYASNGLSPCIMLFEIMPISQFC